MCHTLRARFFRDAQRSMWTDQVRVMTRSGRDLYQPPVWRRHEPQAGTAAAPGHRGGGWRVMQPLVDSPPPVQPYAPGCWGPDDAAKLLTGSGCWHEPWNPA